MEKSPENVKSNDLVEMYSWMVRPCEEYKSELKECKLLRSRFHQYFINGTFQDCSSWNRDVNNCMKCVIDKNRDACKSIIKNETERRLKRITSHKKNDVWKKRDSVPENWNVQLPEWWYEAQKFSILRLQVEEYEKYIKEYDPKRRNLCVIL